jgi:hypothetical protein
MRLILHLRELSEERRRKEGFVEKGKREGERTMRA